MNDIAAADIGAVLLNFGTHLVALWIGGALGAFAMALVQINREPGR